MSVTNILQITVYCKRQVHNKKSNDRTTMRHLLSQQILKQLETTSTFNNTFLKTKLNPDNVISC